MIGYELTEKQQAEIKEMLEAAQEAQTDPDLIKGIEEYSKVLESVYKKMDDYAREYLRTLTAEEVQRHALKVISLLEREIYTDSMYTLALTEADCTAEHYITAEITDHLQILAGNAEAVKVIEEETEKAADRINSYLKSDTAKENIRQYLAGTGNEKPAVFQRRALPAVRRFGLMNDKAAQILQAETFKRETDLHGEPIYKIGIEQASAAEKKKNISVPVYISMTGADDLNVTRPVTALDLAVISSIGSIYHAVKNQNQEEEVYITTAEIWRLLNGYDISDTSAKPHKNQLDRIQRSIERQSVNRVTLDFTKEAERRNFEINGERITKGVIKGNMLQTQSVEIETEKQQRIVSYKINAEPILYRYNVMKKNLQLIDPDLLATGRYLNETAGVIEMKFYLINQIQLMKDKQRNNRKILIKTIYEKTGLKEPDERAQNARKARQQDRKKIEAILKALKAKHFIKGYSRVLEGSAITGYDISI